MFRRKRKSGLSAWPLRTRISMFLNRGKLKRLEAEPLGQMIRDNAFVEANVKLKTTNRLDRFYKIFYEIGDGKTWVPREKRAAAKTFVAVKMAGMELTPEIKKAFLEKLTESDIASLEALIKNFR